MKKIRKIGFACLGLSLALTGISACTSSNTNTNTNTGSSQQTDDTYELTLSQTVASIEWYSEIRLNCSVKGATEYKIGWSSSDDSIATVDETGLVKSLNKSGTVQITATVGSSSASCTVVVVESALAPTIQLETTSLSLSIGDAYPVVPSILWGTNDITDECSLDCKVDNNCVEVEKKGDTFTFKGIKTGHATAMFSSTVRGFVVAESLEIQVIDNSVVFMIPSSSELKVTNDGFEAEITCAAYTGFTNSIELDVIAYVNGVKSDSPITYAYENATDVNYAALSKRSGKDRITGKKFGKIYLQGSFDDGEHVSSFRVAVNITRPIVKISTSSVIEVENLQKEYDISSLLLADGGATGEVNYLGKSIGTLTNGKLSLVKNKLPKNASDLGDVKLSVVVDRYEYELSVKLVTLLINDKAELDSMNKLAIANDSRAQFADGYFALGNNIDYGGVFTPMFNESSFADIGAVGQNWIDGMLCGFKGVFDGQGFNIEGLEIEPTIRKDVYSGGIFGVLATGSIIKDVSFSNAVVAAETAYIATAGDGKIENVYIQYKSMGYNKDDRWSQNVNDPMKRNYSGSFFTSANPVAMGKNASIENCVIDASSARIYDNEKLDANNNKIPGVYFVSNPTLNNRVNALGIYNGDYNEDNSSAKYSGASFAKATASVEAKSFVNNLDTRIWKTSDDFAIFKSLYTQLSSAITVSLDKEVIHAGDELRIDVNYPTSLVDYEISDPTYGEFKYGYFFANSSFAGASKTLTLTVTSKLNRSNKKSVTFDIYKDANLGNIGKNYLNEDIASLTATSITYEKDNYDFDLTNVSRSLSGTFEGIVVNNKFYNSGVSYNSSTKKLTISKTILGLNYGETTMYARFSGVDYKFNVTLVTKVLKNSNDIKSFLRIGKILEPTSAFLYGGYFELGNDIDYDYRNVVFDIGSGSTPRDGMGDVFHWVSGIGNILDYRTDGTDGFKGVFDGCGYSIKNLELVNKWAFGGFISVMHNEGVLRNTAFIDIRLGTDGPTKVKGYDGDTSIVMAGAGLVENVYVTQEWVNVTRPAEGLFYNKNFIAYAAKPVMRNVVIDLAKFDGKSDAELNLRNAKLDASGNYVVSINGSVCTGIGTCKLTAINVGLVSSHQTIINSFTTSGDKEWTGKGLNQSLHNEYVTIKSDLQSLYSSFGSSFKTEWNNVWKNNAAVAKVR
ncbi:MAG: Ig-like domain-containing protein [Bacilli bacterium]|nr:Ig-like domain-containing protein [Bacilli bacterium]